MNKSVVFKPIKNERASQEVAGQIKEMIFEGMLNPGDKLPSEREMSSQFGVSRLTIRDALRNLEHYGLISIRKGASGGHYIEEVDLKPIRDTLLLMLRLQRISLSDIGEIRLILEPDITRMAALKAEPTHIKEIEDLLSKKDKNIKTGELPLYPDFKFHRLIAEATGNPAIIFTMNVIMDFLVNAVSRFFLNIEILKNTAKFHRMIFNAIKNKKPEMAHEIMLNHIKDVNKRLVSLENQAKAQKEERND